MPSAVCASTRTLVVANSAVAKRDPAVYEAPERFEVHRQAPPMVGFGSARTRGNR